MAITPNGQTAYVVCVSYRSVSPISTATNKALNAIKVEKWPTAIAITP